MNVKNTSSLSVFCLFSLLVISFFPVLCHGENDANSLFEQAVKSFKIKGVSLSTKPSELGQFYADNNLKLKSRKVGKNKITYTFLSGKKSKSIRSTVIANGDDSTVWRIDITVPLAIDPISFDALKQQINSHFGDTHGYCNWKKRTFRCRALTDSESLVVKIDLNKKRLKYSLSASPSKKAQNISNRKQEKAARVAQQEEERRQREADQARIEAEHKIQLEKQAKIDAALTAEFLEKISNHPCKQYEVNNLKQVLPCIESLEKRWTLYNAGDLPRVISGATCPAMRDSIVKNLIDFGFIESEARKRRPSCTVLLEIFKARNGTEPYWVSCMDQPDVLTVDSVSRCIASTRLIYIADCSKMAEQYRTNMMAAGHGAENGKLVMPDSGLMSKVCKQLIVSQREAAERSRIARTEAKEKARLQYEAQQEKLFREEEDILHKLYFAKTPEREASKVSASERRLMNKQGRITIPANYGPPVGEDIRLAILRYQKKLTDEGSVYSTTITDGHTLFTVQQNDFSKMMFGFYMGYETSFGDPEDVQCEKREADNSQGYLCQYRMKEVVGYDKITKKRMKRTGAGQAEGIMSGVFGLMDLSSEKRLDWFVLTESGWERRLTREQIAEQRRVIEERKRRDLERLRRQNRARDEEMLDSMMR